MASCLGLYIEDNIIKYAKVTKDNDVVKIDSFGIKFYDRLNEAIEQVIEETYSFKTPISINTPNETYNYFYIFNLLNKKDMHSYINTEFESICFEKELHAESFETRYVLVDDLEDKEKVKAIHISANRGELAKRAELLGKYKLNCISPIAIDISNLLEINKSENLENMAIVNIEGTTTVTSIIQQKIYEINTIDAGITDILARINAKENSYAKAYEICKNSTIYTSEGKELQYEENAYLDDIMPTLYKIVGQVKKILNDSLNKIDKIYITGMASVINNIDIYFQEYLEDVQCEILRPYFIRSVGTELNIKDYIEVNSAIALALQGVGDGLKGINFKKESMGDKLPDWMTLEIGGKGKKNGGASYGDGFSFSLKGALTDSERGLIKGAVGILLLIVIYVVLSSVLNNEMQKKLDEVSVESQRVTQQETAMNTDKKHVDDKKAEYTELIKAIEEKTQMDTESKRLKYSVPTLLNKIMYSIPANVQLTSITNTGSKITIIAQSDRYEQIAMFVAKLDKDGILRNVTTDKSNKESEVVVVTIEGELP